MSNGWDESAEGWIEQMDRHDYVRYRVMDRQVRELFGDVAGKRVLDAGCGEGRASRMLGEMGADVVGLDLCRPLVEAAVARGADGAYVRGNAEKLPFGDSSFDAVLSYIVLLDIPDYRAAVKEMARVLKPGGKVVYVNLQAFATSPGQGWVKDEDKKRLYFPVDHYSFEHGSWAEWGKIKIANYHRPLADYFQAFLDAGLKLKQFREPLPDWDEWPFDADYIRVPWAYITEWTKG